MSWRLTVVHSYSKKMLESGDNQIKKKGREKKRELQTNTSGFAGVELTDHTMAEGTDDDTLQVLR
jgi:hypothetical protein